VPQQDLSLVFPNYNQSTTNYVNKANRAVQINLETWLRGYNSLAAKTTWYVGWPIVQSMTCGNVVVVVVP